MFSELNTVQGGTLLPYPFILTTFLCTLQPATSAIRLIRKLQHSILGLWLAVTQAGVTPARLQTISSPHLHGLVIRLTTLRFGVAVEEQVFRFWLHVMLCFAKIRKHGSGRGGRLRIGAWSPLVILVLLDS